MYRSVMEEVVRFLERCHQSLDALPMGGMNSGGGGRCKSAIYVSNNNTIQELENGHYSSPNINNAGISNRTRSSTNLMDTTKYLKSSQQQLQKEQSINETSSASSYNTFRDFTW